MRQIGCRWLHRVSSQTLAGVLALLISTLFAAPVLAGTVCIDGNCFSCEGTIQCVNGTCVCDGKTASVSEVTMESRCFGQVTVVHANGGGRVATTASVDPAAYVSGDSAVCGSARVAAAVRLTNGSTVSGSCQISGRTTLDRSAANGSATIRDASLIGSTINGSADVSDSEIVNSTVNGSASVHGGSRVVDSVVNGRARVEASRVSRSVLNGRASVVRREIDGAVVND